MVLLVLKYGFVMNNEIINLRSSNLEGSKVYEIPNIEGVRLSVEGSNLNIEGPLGSVCLQMDKLDPNALCSWAIRDNEWVIFPCEAKKKANALSNTLSKLIQQKMIGVSQGYLTKMEVSGVGYRVQLESDQTFCFKLGTSHDVLYKLPDDVRGFCSSPTDFYLYGVDKARVTGVAAQLIALRKPDPYKGKGVRIQNSFIRLKAGKKR